MSADPDVPAIHDEPHFKLKFLRRGSVELPAARGNTSHPSRSGTMVRTGVISLGGAWGRACQLAGHALENPKTVVRSLLQDARTLLLIKNTELRGHDEKTPFATCPLPD